jgi:hypothetical protein
MAKYGIASDEIWEVHGSTWVVKHKALERVAAEVGIIWDRPAMIETSAEKNTAVICVFGKLGERSEWSIGEAAPSNYKVSGKMSAYPYAMAEKRGKDRVILKLLNASAALYSEAEADEFGENRNAEGGLARLAKKDAKGVYTKLQEEMRSCSSLDTFKTWMKANVERIKMLPEDWEDTLRLQCEEQLLDLKQKEAA